MSRQEESCLPVRPSFHFLSHTLLAGGGSREAGQTQTPRRAVGGTQPGKSSLLIAKPLPLGSRRMSAFEIPGPPVRDHRADRPWLEGQPHPHSERRLFPGAPRPPVQCISSWPKAPLFTVCTTWTAHHGDNPQDKATPAAAAAHHGPHLHSR